MIAFAFRYWRVIAAVVGIVSLLGGAGGFVLKIKHDAYQSGHDAGRAEAEAKCAADKRAQEAANKKAADEAAKKLDALEHELEMKDLQIDDYLKAIDLAADQEPGSTEQCLSADSVRRLGAIQ